MWIRLDDGCIVNISKSHHIYYSSSDRMVLARFYDDGGNFNKEDGNTIVLLSRIESDEGKKYIDSLYDMLASLPKR